MSQQVLRDVDSSIKSFFGLLKLKKENKYSSSIHLPRYKKKNSFSPIIISFVRSKAVDDKLILDLPRSNFIKRVSKFYIDQYNNANKYNLCNHLKLMPSLSLTLDIPKIITDKEIKIVKIIPNYNASYFEAQFTYVDNTEVVINQTGNEIMAIDLGVNNLVTGVVTNKDSFIIDGKYLKSINQYYNKEISRLRSIKDKRNIKTFSKKEVRIMTNRKNQVEYYINKASRMVISKAIEANVGTIVIGYNEGIKQQTNIGKVNNQNFASIPFQKLKNRLNYLASTINIKVVIQEEAYTSKSSFFDDDDLPFYDSDKKYQFSGRRIKRGLYKTSNGRLINADINAALNILRKSNLDKTIIKSLQFSGVNTPIRLKVV